MFNSIHKSFKMLFPVVVRDDDDDEDDEGSDEVEAIGEDGPALKKKTRRRSSLGNVVRDIKDAVKSRCPSTWTDKENLKVTINGTVTSSSSSSSSFNQKFDGDNGKDTQSRSLEEQGNTSTQPVVKPSKEPRKISLKKVEASSDLSTYECASNHELLIIGHKRMFFVIKTPESEHVATVEWVQSYHDIQSCTITFDTITEGGTDVSLDMTAPNNIQRKVRMPDPVVCAKILEIIREKKQGTMAKASNSPKVAKNKGLSESKNLNSSATLTSTPRKPFEGTKNVKNPKISTPSFKIHTEDRHSSGVKRKRGDSSGLPKKALERPLSAACIVNDDAKEKTEETEKDVVIPEGTDVLVGESEAEYVARQRKLNEQRREQHIARMKRLFPDLGNEAVASIIKTPLPELSSTPASRNTKESKKATEGTCDDVSATRGVTPTVTPLVVSISASASSSSKDARITSSAKSASSAIKYARMVKAGIPIQAVKNRMLSEGLDPSLLDEALTQSTSATKYASMPQERLFLPESSVETPVDKDNQSNQAPLTTNVKSATLNKDASGSNATASLDVNSSKITKTLVDDKRNEDTTASTATALKRFEKMVRAGVPIAAVKAKVVADGLDPSALDAVLDKSLVTTSSSTTTTPASDTVEKFQKMLKAGVPRPAIEAKMKNEGYDPSLLDTAKAAKAATDEIAQDGPSEKPHIEKYKKMIKAGVPLPAVHAKMKLENLDPALLDDDKSNIASSTQSTPSIALAIKNPLLEKYKKMVKAGVPLNAVKAKMQAEGQVDPSLLDDSSSIQHNKNELTEIETKGNSVIQKFLKMVKAGVPRAAVEAKMKLEGLDPALLDGNSSNTIHSMSKGASGDKILASGGPKLLGLHWEPLADDKLQDSVWSNVDPNVSALPTEELTGLVSMFERKNTTNKRQSVNENEGSNQGHSSKKRKGANPTHIDMSRSTNIAIGLASFKNRGMGPKQLADAVEKVQISILSAEDLLRLQEILPTDSEIKILSGQGITYEDLHESEKCLYQLSKVKDLKPKVQSMLFMSTCSQTILHLGSDLAILRESCGQVLLSRGLQEVMKCILAIGNAMNEGTWKGGASGFRLSALSKLHQTKANDGSTTVLDYLIQLLYTRKDAKTDGMASAAINIDTELNILTKCKSLSITELSNECANLQKSYNMARKIIDDLPTRVEVTERVQNVGPLETDNKILLQSGMEVLNEIVEDEGRIKLMKNLQLIKTQIDTLTSAIESAKEKALEMNKFFGEDQSLGHVGVVINLLADFVDAFAQSKSKFARKQKSKEKERQKEYEKMYKLKGSNKEDCNENDPNKQMKQCFHHEKENEILSL